MKQVIWFFGSSAAGKKTLIEAIANNPEAFKEKFNLANTNIKICEEALEWVTQKNHHERPNLVSIISNTLKDESEAVVLIKGQAPDLKHNLLHEFEKMLPDVKQEIIFVYTEPAEELERWKQHRAWYNPSMSEKDVIGEINYQLKLIEELKPLDIPVVCVDGGENADYKIINFPPPLS